MNMLVVRLVFLMALAAPGALRAQEHLAPDRLLCNPVDSLLQVHPMYSDSLCSSFMICIPRGVAGHYHRYHTEHVTVLEGTGIMLLADSVFSIAAGHSVVIPKGAVHSVTTTSATPLRVISVQSPYFDGSDRVFIEP